MAKEARVCIHKDDISLPPPLLPIEGIKIFQRKSYKDARGEFQELYKKETFANEGVENLFDQDNLSFSSYGVLRGMHFQREPYPQAKLVSVLQGEIFDVAVDIRPFSPTFKKWFGLLLSADNRYQLYIPAGFAHGFCVTSPEGALVHYKASNSYSPYHEASFHYLDKEIAILWPISSCILSSKDQQAPSFRDIEQRGLL